MSDWDERYERAKATVAGRRQAEGRAEARERSRAHRRETLAGHAADAKAGVPAEARRQKLWHGQSAQQKKRVSEQLARGLENERARAAAGNRSEQHLDEMGAYWDYVDERHKQQQQAKTAFARQHGAKWQQKVSGAAARKAAWDDLQNKIARSDEFRGMSPLHAMYATKRLEDAFEHSHSRPRPASALPTAAPPVRRMPAPRPVQAWGEKRAPFDDSREKRASGDGSLWEDMYGMVPMETSAAYAAPGPARSLCAACSAACSAACAGR